MYVCTYVTYVRIRTYVRMYVCTYVRMYVCTYVRTYVRMYVLGGSGAVGGYIGDILGTYGTYYLDTALTVCHFVDLLGQHLAHLHKWLTALT